MADSVDEPQVRRGFAHEAVVVLDHDDDPRSIGAAITVRLCGSMDHDPPCPLAPHHTAYEQSGPDVRVRVLFAAQPADEDVVRREIDAALRASAGEDNEGRSTGWRLSSAGPSTVRPAEADHARRLAES